MIARERILVARSKRIYIHMSKPGAAGEGGLLVVITRRKSRHDCANNWQVRQSVREVEVEVVYAVLRAYEEWEKVGQDPEANKSDL